MSGIELIIFLFLCLIIFFLGFLIFRFYSEKDKTKTLYFNSDMTCELQNKKVENDFIEHKDKAFKISDTKPFMLKSPFGWKPFFILKHDIPHPIGVQHIESKELSPEIVNRLIKQNVVKELLSAPKQVFKEMLLYVALGICAGAGVGYILAKGMA